MHVTGNMNIRTCFELSRCRAVAVLTILGLMLTASSVPASESTPPEKPTLEKLIDQRVKTLRKSLPSEMTVVAAHPFVVVGNESASRVRSRAVHTVGWAVRMLQKDYFPKDPDHVIDIYLLKNRATYEAFCEKTLGRKPNTPFGFYHPGKRMMVMNIATGGGTLVHEIVHPLMAANFPLCPAWYNEGLGSLYEQSAERDGKIVGLSNWRLPALQKAIKADKAPSLREVCQSSTDQFYNRKASGANYAVARYLCHYLQERKLLRTFHHEFVKNVESDATGWKTLLKVTKLNEAQLQAAFEKHAMSLSFPAKTR